LKQHGEREEKQNKLVKERDPQVVKKGDGWTSEKKAVAKEQGNDYYSGVNENRTRKGKLSRPATYPRPRGKLPRGPTASAPTGLVKPSSQAKTRGGVKPVGLKPHVREKKVCVLEEIPAIKN